VLIGCIYRILFISRMTWHFNFILLNVFFSILLNFVGYHIQRYVTFTPSYVRFVLFGGFTVIWIYIFNYCIGLYQGLVFVCFFDTEVYSLSILWWESYFGSYFARTHSELANFLFWSIYLHVLLNIYKRVHQVEIDYVWLHGIFILLLTYVADITGVIMPSLIISKELSLVVGYSINLVTLFTFDFFEVILIPNFGLTNDTLSTVFIIHFIAPTLILVIAINHAGSSYQIDYFDEDNIDDVVILCAYRREYMTQAFLMEAFYWFTYSLFFITLKIIIDFLLPSYMTVPYTLSNLEFWPVIEISNQIIAVPGWYLRPLIGFLVVIPPYYPGFIYFILLFVVLLFQPWYEYLYKGNYSYTIFVNVYFRFPIDITMYINYFFVYLCFSLVYIITFIYIGWDFIFLQNTDLIVITLWFSLVYFVLFCRLSYFLHNFIFTFIRLHSKYSKHRFGIMCLDKTWSYD